MSKMVTVTKSVEIDAVWAGQCPICGQALEMRDVYREDGEAWTEHECYNCGKTWYIVFKYSHIETTMREYTQNDEHQFKQHFGLELKDFWDLTGFDIIKFDDLMHPPDDVSLREHLTSTYSEDAAKLVERLIHIW